MARRWVGILILLLAVISVVAVDRLKGGHVVGNAIAAPISPAPRVGDCLLDPIDLTEAQAIYTQKPWVTGTCTDHWYGEVTALIDYPDKPASWPHSDDVPAATPDPALFSCQAAAYDYIGAVVADSAVVEWSPALRVGTVALDPSEQQQAIGQRWRACALFQYPEEGDTAAEAPSITQRLHDVIATGPVSDSLAVCMSDAGLLIFEYLACGEPHTIQLVALGSINQPVQRTDPLIGCSELAQQLTRRPGLEADGALDIDVRYFDLTQSGPQPAVVDDAEIRVGTTAVCLIRSTTGRPLAGSLFGLGDQPIPWS